jgi:nucleotidyltransferase/DNA polymerase involved in DNA repair
VLPRNQKSLSSGETLNNVTNSYEEIVELLKRNSKEISQQLSSMNKSGGNICLAVKDEKFVTKSKTIQTIIFDYESILSSVIKIFQDNFLNKKLRTLTIHVGKLTTNNQTNIFDDSQNNQDVTLEVVIKFLNEKYGKKVMFTADELH